MFHPTMDIGGAPINNIALATKLQKFGHQVVFLADDGPLVDELKVREIKYRQLATRGRSHFSVQLLRDVVRAIREEEADVVWTSGILPCLKAHVACWLTNTPLFPLHGSPNVPLFYLPKVGKCGWVTPHHRDYMVKVFGWKDEDVVLIRGRMEIDTYQPALQRNGFLLKYGVREGDQVVALIGNVIKEKWGSIGLFLEAANMLAKRHRNLRFLIVGEGLKEYYEHYERCKQLAEEINLDYGREVVILTGALRQVSEVMNEADIIAGMGSTCIISLLCGRPTIVLGNRGFSGIISPESFDEIAYNHFNMHEPSKQKQPEELCHQIGSLLDDDNWRGEIGKFGRKMAIEIFDVNIGTYHFEQALKTITSHKQDFCSRMRWLIEILKSLVSGGAYKLRKGLSTLSQESSKLYRLPRFLVELTLPRTFHKLYSLLKGSKTPGRLYFEELLQNNQRYIDGLVLNVGGGTRTYRGLSIQMISVDCSAEADADVICEITGGLPFRSGIFQSVICTSVLEHIADTKTAISEISRVLAQGGLLIYFTPFLHKYHADPHDYWRFTKEGIEYVLHYSSFEIVSLISVGGKLSLILHIMRSSKWLAPVSRCLFPIVKRLERHVRDNEDWALGFFAIARKKNESK